MTTFHLKVTCHKNNQEDVQMNEKNPTDVNTKMTEKVVSSDKVIKAVMIKKCFNVQLGICLKQMKTKEARLKKETRY